MSSAVSAARDSLSEPLWNRIVGEDGRIGFLLERDGLEATIAWVWRTLRIYRAAVLDKNHHASRDGFRRGYVESYCDFKRWLSRMHALRSPDGTSS